ncbi:MAG: tRNA (adenosine(37)-N6)-dimethylallyltransferase MiaA [Rhizobiales bacterium]|nr:tRNA (adenosine(37)-N6)-dimethylallyltransferase MiaA [Hyphomicrobiales bacterium]
MPLASQFVSTWPRPRSRHTRATTASSSTGAAGLAIRDKTNFIGAKVPSGRNRVTNKQKRAVLIAGPTASGKSGAAVAIAQRLGGIVINADAMQVYDDLKVVSARPSPQEQAGIPHYLFGHVDAGERYSVGRWLEDVAPVLSAAARRGQYAVIVGGTGLYFKTLLEGLSTIPDIPSQITSHWNRQLKEHGSWALHSILMAQDAETADELDSNDSQRIVRALCVRQATGKSIRQFSNSQPLLADSDITIQAALLPDRKQLYARIEERFDNMIEAGALPEVEALIVRGLPDDLPAMRAIGVPELAGFLSGEQTLDEAIEKAKTNSRRYAKRQMTWIRGQMADWTLFTEPEDLVSQCLDLCGDQA